MGQELKTKLVSSSLKRTFIVFLVGGLILSVAENVIILVWDILWIDFINYNPYRSQTHALYLIAQSPIDALIVSLYYSPPLIIGASIAVISHGIWGRVPFFSLIIMLPFCAYAIYKQVPSGPKALDYLDFLWFSLSHLPVLVGCWWWSHSTQKR